jgi:FlaA1/EpsC-like NDP-sugar epimerase
VLNTLLQWLVRRPRLQKRGLQIATDTVLLTLSFLGAMALRLDGVETWGDADTWIAIGLTLPVTILIFIRTGFYRAVIRYISTRALRTIFWGIAASAVFLFALSQALGLFVPRSVPGIYAMLAFLSVGGVRFFLRELFFSQQRKGRTTVLIYGAGTSGRDLVKVLGQGRQYTPIGFVDANAALHGSDIMGLRVYSPAQLPQLLTDHGIDLVMLAMPRLTRSERREIIDRLAEYTVEVQLVPEIDDILSGRAEISEIREVAPTDLLGRDPVPPVAELMSANIAGKTVLVTGAGGSIGSELCRQVATQGAARLVLLETSEPALYAIDMELRERPGAPPVTAVLGSVQDAAHMAHLLAEHRVDTIYHAAAYKHVPLVEANCLEGVRNNVAGTHVLARAAVEANVSAFIMVSTDKAVRPTNVMGASKRLAELICQAYATEATATTFSMVRFGNVLGSSGSVIPRFRSQINRGGPVTVTDARMTRFFMSIPEAAQLVIQAGAMARGGDVFVLDMGEPVRILDLADRMIRLSGLTPYVRGQGHGDIEITFTGLRPGEKLYEELLIGADKRDTAHPRIMTALEDKLPMLELKRLLARIDTACTAHDPARLRDLLRSAPLGYKQDADEAEGPPAAEARKAQTSP